MKTIVGCVAVLTVLFILEARRRIERAQSRLRQAFTHRLITTQEDERKRIAHELHDSLGQHLVLIRRLAMLPRPAPSTAAGNHLSKIAEQAAEAIHEVEAISYDLRPYQLDRLGLTKAVQSLIQSLEASQSLTVKCSLDNVDTFFPRTSRSISTALFRKRSATSSNMHKPRKWRSGLFELKRLCE